MSWDHIYFLILTIASMGLTAVLITIIIFIVLVKNSFERDGD